MEFSELSLHEDLQKGIAAAGYVTCTPVQEQVLRSSLDGADLYVQSQTGTGKTAAYLVSIIQEMIAKPENAGTKALIMVPTRELAVQVEEEAKKLSASTSLNVFSFYGGVGYEKQTAALKKGVDILVGTPGRVIDLQEGGQMDLSKVAFLVIDEADRMFDMGFYPDLRTLIKVLPQAEERQTMLFSATLNSYVKNLAWEYTRDPVEITIDADTVTVEEIDQELLHVSSDEKMKLLIGILNQEKPVSLLIFCNTKRMCEVLSKRLQINGFKSEFIIGDLPQSRRLKVLDDFESGQVPILVATDVAARGIDVADLAMVINFDLPNEAENYVHRIGRTARAGKSGKAYTFCSEQDVYNLPAIERYIGNPIPAKVADPAWMAEDKSAGQYIRTENWHDGHEDRDDDAPRGRRGSSRDAGDRRGRGRRSGERTERGERPARRTSARRGERRDDQDLTQLENLSFDERMKLYKEKYAAPGAAADSGRYEKKRRGEEASGGRGRRNDGATHDSRRGTRGEKYGASAGSRGAGRNPRSGNRAGFAGSASGTRDTRAAAGAVRREAAAPAKKQGLLSKIKSLFGRGKQ